MIPIITFVVPAYTAQDTLERTIESILHQTDDRYLVILVNDGSTDRTHEICEQYAGQYADKITYVKQENRGLGGARNHGMEFVNTPYVSFLDSDDWLMPDYVEKISNCIASNKEEIEMILTLPKIYHEKSGVVREWYDEGLFHEIFSNDGVVINPQEEKRVYQFEVNFCRKVLNTDWLRKISFQFREQIKWEDVFPHFYLLSKCRHCMGVGSVGFYYRIGNSGQITASRGKDRLDMLCVFEDICEYVKKESREDICFPVMRVMVRFAIWGIRMSDTDTRRRLVKALHQFFIRLPKQYKKALRQGTRKNYAKADAMQYYLFLFAIEVKPLNWIFYDYLYQDIGERLVKKLLHAKERVA